MKRIAFLVWMGLLLLAACAPPPSPLTTPEPTTPAPPAASTDMPIPDVQTATPSPTWTATPAPPIFGEPVNLGRGGIQDADFSRDASRLAIGWTNGVSVIQVDDLTEQWYVPLPEVVIAVGHGAAHVAAVTTGGDVWLFDAGTGAAQEFSEAAKRWAYWGDLAWSPAGDVAAIQTTGPGGGDPVLLLDPRTETIIALEGTRVSMNWFPVLRWSPDGSQIAALDGAGQGWVLDATTGKPVFRLPHGDDACCRGQIRAWLTKQHVIADAPDGGLAVFDVETGEQVDDLGQFQLGDRVLLPELVDHRLLLAREPADHPYEITPFSAWNLESEVWVARGLGERRSTSSAGCMILDRPAVAVRDEAVLTFDTDGRFMRWPLDGSPGEIIAQLEMRVPCIGYETWSPDSTYLASWNNPGGVVVWEPATGELVLSLPEGRRPFTLSADLLAYTDTAGNLALAELATGSVRRTLPGPVTLHPAGAAFSPDGERIAYGVGSELYIASVASGEVLNVLAGYPDEHVISHLYWAPDGGAIIAASAPPKQTEPGDVVLWSLPESEERFRVLHWAASYDPGWSLLAAFSPSGRYVAFESNPTSSAPDLSLLVYDRETGETVLDRREFVLHRWLSDEVLLGAEAQYDTRYVEWNLVTGETTLGRRQSQMELYAYAPDGIHHGGIDLDRVPSHYVQITEWRTGKQVATAWTSVDAQLPMNFSPDGRWFAAHMTHGLIRVWPVALPPAP